MKSVARDTNAERVILGSIVLDSQHYYPIASDVLEASDWYDVRHQTIWEAIVTLAKDSNVIDTNLLVSQLTVTQTLGRAGGHEYIDSLTDVIPQVDAVLELATRVHELAVVRGVARTALEIAAEASEPIERCTDFVERAEQAITVACASTRAKRAEPSESALERVMLDALRRYESGSTVVGYETGLQKLDSQLGGMVPGEYVVLAARPSQGKSSLAQRIAIGVAHSSQRPVLFVTLETQTDALCRRILSAEAHVDGQHIRSAKLGRDEWGRLDVARGRLRKLKLYFADSSSTTVHEIRSMAREIARKGDGLGLVVVDYLQLIRGPKADSREQEVAEISRGLHALALEHNVPVLALSQLNRGCEARSDKRPMLSDLRESGAIEQDADTVLFLYRDEVYNRDSPDAGTAEVIVAKQRNGLVGTFKLAFRPEYTAFENLEQVRQEELC